MNKTFKTLWNDVRRCYIVANEAQKSHGKPSKCAVAVAVAATALLSAGIANATYVEEGKLGSTSSWESEEYGTDVISANKRTSMVLRTLMRLRPTLKDIPARVF